MWPRWPWKSGGGFLEWASRLVLPLVVALLLLFQPGAGAAPASLDVPPLAAVLDDLAAPGWAPEGGSRGFSADNLWEYIDGDADRYVDAGLSEMRTATYRHRGKLEAVVDVYRMAEPAGAQRLFRSESTGDWSVVDLGDEARQSDLVLVFRVGADLVRIVAYDMTPETANTLRALGEALAARLRPR